MPDVRDVFRRTTQEVRPDPGAIDRLYARQRRVARKRQLGAIAMVAAIAAALALVFAVIRPLHGAVPATQPPPAPHTLGGVIVGLDGKVQSTIPGMAPDAFELSLSPDGTKVVYITTSTRVGDCGSCRPAGLTRMAVVNTDGTGSHFAVPAISGFGDLRQCHRPLHLTGTCFGQPAWSPDGSRIAFVMTRNANTDIYVMKPDGSGVRRLTTDPALDEFPTWSPDGTTIAYDSSGSTTLDSSGFSPTQEIWSVPANGGSPRQLTHDLVPDQAPTYSPDGRQIAFYHDGSIWVMAASGGAINPISVNLQVFATTPRWSPDGTRIAVLGFPGPNLRGTIADPRDGGRITSLPRATVDILEVSSGHVTHLSVPVLTSTNAASWMPSGDALLVDRYTP